MASYSSVESRIGSMAQNVPFVIQALLDKGLCDFKENFKEDSLAITKVAITCIALLKASWSTNDSAEKAYQLEVTVSDERSRDQFLLAQKTDAEIKKYFADNIKDIARNEAQGVQESSEEDEAKQYQLLHNFLTNNSVGEDVQERTKKFVNDVRSLKKLPELTVWDEETVDDSKQIIFDFIRDKFVKHPQLFEMMAEQSSLEEGSSLCKAFINGIIENHVKHIRANRDRTETLRSLFLEHIKSAAFSLRTRMDVNKRKLSDEDDTVTFEEVFQEMRFSVTVDDGRTLNTFSGLFPTLSA